VFVWEYIISNHIHFVFDMQWITFVEGGYGSTGWGTSWLRKLVELPWERKAESGPMRWEVAGLVKEVGKRISQGGQGGWQPCGLLQKGRTGPRAPWSWRCRDNRQPLKDQLPGIGRLRFKEELLGNGDNNHSTEMVILNILPSNGYPRTVCIGIRTSKSATKATPSDCQESLIG
jgi:hypothetical protein